MGKNIVPFKKTYVSFNAFDTDVRFPRLDMIKGDYVRITLKALAIEWYMSSTSIVIIGDIYLSPVSSKNMTANSDKSSAIHLFIDKSQAVSARANFYKYNANNSDSLYLLVDKSQVSGMNIQLKHNIVRTGGGSDPIYTSVKCVVEICDAEDS